MELTREEETQVKAALNHFNLQYGGQENAPEVIRVPIMPQLTIIDYASEVPPPFTPSFKVVELIGKNGHYRCDLIS